jgi:hypothetical protein
MAKKTTLVVEAAEAAPTLEFDVWLAMRKSKIPAQHHREILLADFRARGLSLRETEQAYDDALAAYGIR